jgi:hypothetical protein
LFKEKYSVRQYRSVKRIGWWRAAGEAGEEKADPKPEDTGKFPPLPLDTLTES